jgi:hypothetical protein
MDLKPTLVNYWNGLHSYGTAQANIFPPPPLPQAPPPQPLNFGILNAMPIDASKKKPTPCFYTQEFPYCCGMELWNRFYLEEVYSPFKNWEVYKEELVKQVEAALEDRLKKLENGYVPGLIQVVLNELQFKHIGDVFLERGFKCIFSHVRNPKHDRAYLFGLVYHVSEKKQKGFQIPTLDVDKYLKKA